MYCNNKTLHNRGLCLHKNMNKLSRKCNWLRQIFLLVCVYMLCCSLFNDGHVLHLRSEIIVICIWMNMMWMVNLILMIHGDESCLNILTFALQLRKTPKKPSNRKLTRLGNEPGPAAWEAIHSGVTPMVSDWPFDRTPPGVNSNTFDNWQKLCEKVELKFHSESPPLWARRHHARLSSSYPIVLARLGGPRSIPYTCRKISRV